LEREDDGGDDGEAQDDEHGRAGRGGGGGRSRGLVVALQVAFERQTLKPVFRLIRYRLWV
jgi:hypothetical protein